MPKVLVLGAGLTGLAAGIASGGIVVEKKSRPGGLARTTIVDGYVTGFSGHWLFGGSPISRKFVMGIADCHTARRDATVFINGRYVPAPIQANVDVFDDSARIYAELAARPQVEAKTFDEYLLASFGPTLYERFFGPFNDKYTDGLMRIVKPVTGKNPVAPLETLLRGGKPVAYNQEFLYVDGGMHHLVDEMARMCNVRYGENINSIDIRKKIVISDKYAYSYDVLVSTIPLLDLARLCNGRMERDALLKLSAYCVNIGCGKVNFPGQWCYFPGDEPFYRLGNYTAVDPTLAPIGRSLVYADVNTQAGMLTLKQAETFVVGALKNRGWVEDVDMVRTYHIDTAYTFIDSDSGGYAQKILDSLASIGVLSVGSYGRWKFGGMMADIEEGLLAGAAARML